MTSSKASDNSIGQDSAYFHGWQFYEKSPFDQVENPTGIIQMGLAENQKLVDYMAKMRGNRVKFDPNNLVLAAGATSANETLIFCLADPGEAILLPTPYYPGDLKWRTGVEIVPVRCSSSDGFRITMFALEDAYQRAEKLNLNVKCVVITNPSNLLVYGLLGFRVGMIYSDNETVISAATKMPSFGLVSSQTQYLLSNVLADKKFMTCKYMKENQKRLKKRKEMLVSGLKKSGIGCLKSNAVLFSWVDMRHLLSSNTLEAETKPWDEIISHARLNISCGSSFHCFEPGWFRVCFANMSHRTIQVAMRRIKDFVERLSFNGGIKMSYQQNVFTLSRKLLSNWVRKLSSANRAEQER
ncbi:Detected protein of unknown function [Hibiscus syriacus]|uniref:Aminotransferase class I/classII large domain-containing protein n=1 Tax=Hibiscus syriacus TaxID=106335 RepID=A0A6A2YGP7_HIBSY|nr:Detected protein of unknown function [Hibiscus syriacus]